jgi:hypothetical protein
MDRGAGKKRSQVANGADAFFICARIKKGDCILDKPAYFIKVFYSLKADQTIPGSFSKTYSAIWRNSPGAVG